MDCPRCKLSMVREVYEGVEVDLCQSCWGMWLDSGELETIIRSRKFEFSPEEKQVILQGRRPRSRGPVTPVACPKCSTRMERLYLDSGVHLVLDRCTDHGVWLDTGEVKVVQAVAEASLKASKLILRMLNARKGRTD